MTSSLTDPAYEKPPPDGVTAEGEAWPSGPARLSYVDVDPPQPGKSVAIAPGIRWCRIPLPLDLNHINVWLLDTADGCVLVDTGMAASIGRSAWELLESEVLDKNPLRAIFITHIHPDHIGLAAWLQQRHHVPVLMSKRTHEQAQLMLSGNVATHAEGAQTFFLSNGVTDLSTLKPIFLPDRFAKMASGLPSVDHHVGDTEVLQWGSGRWMALETNGHAEGHLCLWSAAQQLLISGDQVLPTISSNVSFTWYSRDPNPLHSFLASLQRLRALPDDTLVLPSHGVAFRGLQHRIDDLCTHHHEQLDKIIKACGEPQCAAQILPVMFRRTLTGMHLLLGLGEALAHLEYLVHAGRLWRSTDANGIIRYTSA